LAQGSDAIGIYSIYDTKLQLVNSTKFDEFTIDGSTYANQALTIVALLKVIYSSNAIEDTIENEYPTTGVYRNYQEVIENSSPVEESLLVPHMSITDIMAITFTSGNLQIREYYRVTGTGAQISHNGVTFDEGEEFRATVTTFSTVAGTPVIVLGTQHSKFGDSSQLYNPQVMEVGDYYFMYYIGNTQKYMQEWGTSIAPDGTLTNVVTPGSTTNNADYGRNDQIFLAYKLKSEGLYNGKWQKWANGTSPVLAISGEYSGANDASNAWLRNMFQDASQYVMFYNGDSAPDGSAHVPHPMWATSTDGIIWTKGGSVTTAGLGNLQGGMMFYENGKYYIMLISGTNIVFYYNATLASTGWTLISSDLIPGYDRVYSYRKENGISYFGFRATGNTEDIIMYSCPTVNLDSPTFTNLGTLFSTDNGTTPTLENENRTSTASGVNYHSIIKVDTNKWALFYNYYRSDFCSFPYVNNTAIRMLSFANTVPVPSE